MTNSGYDFYPTHPGEVLKDELEARGISQRKFADGIGMGYSVLNEILNGHRSLSTTSALIFEAALDIPADSLMRLQLKYDMQTAHKDKTLADRLKKIARTAAIL
jgi:addiction module HigA family antidote